MITKIVEALKQRANLFRAQLHPGTNIFDQAAQTIDRLHKENERLSKELVFQENMIKLLASIEVADIPEDAIDCGVVTDPNFMMIPVKKSSQPFEPLL